jgi:hypothetical protein
MASHPSLSLVNHASTRPVEESVYRSQGRHLRAGGGRARWTTFSPSSPVDGQAVRRASMSAFPSPVIHSARLDLREWGPGDAGRVREVLTSAAATAGGNERPPDDAGPRGRQNRRVHRPVSRRLGGPLGGVARWALTEGGIQRAWLTANTDNMASVRVAEKAGFHREGTLRRAGLEEDGLHDLAVFSLLDDELLSGQPALA